MKQLLSISVLIMGSLFAQSQIAINEVIYSPAQTVELKNMTDSTVDVSSYWLCSFPIYTQVQNMTVVSGNTMLGAGELLVVSGHSYGATDDELGLYLTGSFSDPTSIIDYVEWGSPGHTRSTIAVMAGIWSTGDFVDNVTGIGSLEWDGTGDASTDWQVSASSTEGAENSNVPVGCDATAIVVGNQTTCAGGTGTFQVVLTGIAPWTFTYSLNGVLQDPIVTSDSPYSWTVTEAGTYLLNGVTDATCEGTAQGAAQLNIVDVPAATLLGPETFCSSDTAAALVVEITGFGPWDLEYQIDGAPQGSVTITSSPAFIPVSTPGFYNLVSVSNSLCDGTVSGSANVAFIDVDGGDLSYNGTTDPAFVCVDDGLPSIINFETVSTSGTNSTLIITDEAGEILALPSGMSIDFEGSEAGNCLVWNISYEDPITGLNVGDTIPDDLDGCLSLSNPITIVREAGIDCTTSLDEQAFLQNLQLFPNPVEDILNISINEEVGSALQLRILDLTGKELLSRTLRPGLVNHQLDLSEFSTGLYMLSLQDESGRLRTLTLVK